MPMADLTFELGRFAAGVARGEMVRHGAIIRDALTGRIVGHVQETAGFGNVVSSLLPGSPTGLAKLALGAVRTVQNEQIKAGIAVLQSLQLGGLALSGVGIGVSIAGMALLAQRIDRVGARVGAMSETLQRIARQVEALRLEPIRHDLDALHTAGKEVEEGWLLADPEPHWRRAASDLHHLQTRFARRARELDAVPDADTGLRDAMVEAFVASASTRVSARVVAGDMAAAEMAATEHARELADLTGGMGVLQLLARALDGNEEPAGRLRRIDELRPAIEAQAALIRDREDAAATTPITIAALRERGISGRAWLERARTETEASLIVLPAPA